MTALHGTSGECSLLPRIRPRNEPLAVMARSSAADPIVEPFVALSNTTQRSPAMARLVRIFSISAGSSEYPFIAGSRPLAILPARVASQLLPVPAWFDEMRNAGTGPSIALLATSVSTLASHAALSESALNGKSDTRYSRASLAATTPSLLGRSRTAGYTVFGT